MENKNVPQWILDSTTGINEQNDEVGLVVAGYIGAFMKRGFTQADIGIALSKAFLLPVQEVEARLDERSEDSELFVLVNQLREMLRQNTTDE